MTLSGPELSYDASYLSRGVAQRRFNRRSGSFPRGRHHCIDEGPQHLAQTLALGWLWRHGCSPNTHLGSKLHLLLPVSKLLSVELLKRVEQLLLQFLYRLQTL